MPVYVVDKPLGISSHDAVARARRQLGTRRVGHAGTLDPLASGVLVLLAEEATKLSPFLTGADKEYLAWVAFGATTATLDAEGPVGARSDPSGLSEARLRAALPPFLELSAQQPPAYSAVKREGVRSYAAARRGEKLELPLRPAGYRRIDLLGFAASRVGLPDRFARGADGLWRPSPEGRTVPLPPELEPLPTALLALRVAAGTYIRAFARDLGEALGVPAHLSGLVRTRSGRFGLEEARPLGELALDQGRSPADSLPYPLVPVSDEEAARVRQGQRLPLDLEGRVGLIDRHRALIAVVEIRRGRMDLLRVWPA